MVWLCYIASVVTYTKENIMPSDPKITSENDLILLYNGYAVIYASDPKRQLESFEKLIDNPYATPKVFETLIGLLDKVLDADADLFQPVLDLLRKVLRTKRANAENCDHMMDMLKAQQQKLPKYYTGSINVFSLTVKGYKAALRDMDNALAMDSGAYDANSSPTLDTKYGVVRPEPTLNTKYGVVGPTMPPINPGLSTKYGVVCTRR